jgi:hypothetical protein
MDQRRIERRDGDSARSIADVHPAIDRIPVANRSWQLVLLWGDWQAIDVGPKSGIAEVEGEGNEHRLDVCHVLLVEQPVDLERLDAGPQAKGAACGADAARGDVDGDRYLSPVDDRAINDDLRGRFPDEWGVRGSCAEIFGGEVADEQGVSLAGIVDPFVDVLANAVPVIRSGIVVTRLAVDPPGNRAGRAIDPDAIRRILDDVRLTAQVGSLRLACDWEKGEAESRHRAGN